MHPEVSQLHESLMPLSFHSHTGTAGSCTAPVTLAYALLQVRGAWKSRQPVTCLCSATAGVTQVAAIRGPAAWKAHTTQFPQPSEKPIEQSIAVMYSCHNGQSSPSSVGKAYTCCLYCWQRASISWSKAARTSFSWRSSSCHVGDEAGHRYQALAGPLAPLLDVQGRPCLSPAAWCMLNPMGWAIFSGRRRWQH